METLSVIYVEPGKEARVIEMKDELSEMQNLVGGYIEEYMPFEDDVALVCNDEGKMHGLPLNRAIQSEDGQVMEILAGPFFICYAPIESEKFLSLPKELEEKYQKKFDKPKQFFRTDSGIKAVKYDPVPQTEHTAEGR